MLTNPNTLGLFDENITEIASIVHEVGGTLYYDGANLNAIMGRTRPGRHGVRHRPRQPPQVVLPAARRRRARRRADRGLRSDRALPAGAADRATRGRRTGAAPTFDLELRAAEVDRQAARLPGQLRRLRPLLRLHLEPRRRRPARGVGDRGPQRQLPARPAARRARRQVPAARLRPHPACTSSSSQARRRSASSG